MGTVTVREVLWAVSGLLNDTNSQFDRWPETELVQWLDDAQMALAKYLPASCSRTDVFKLASGTKQSIAQIPAASLMPEDGSNPPTTTYGMEFLGAVRNMGDDGLTPGRAITPVGRSDLDDQHRDWHTKVGEYVKHVTFDPRIPQTFYVSPAAAGKWIELQHVVQPAKIPNTGSPGSEVYAWSGSNATKLTVRDEHRDDVINYVCARAKMKNTQSASDQSSAGMFSQLFLGSLNAKVQVATGNNPNLKRLPMQPANIGTAS